MLNTDRILAERYSKAYMGIYGKSADRDDETAARRRLESLRKAAEMLLPYSNILKHPVLGINVKKEILKLILGKEFESPSGRLASLLLEKNRFALIDEIIRRCEKALNEFLGIFEVQIQSRYPLPENELKRIKSIFSAACGQKIALREEVSQNIIGGFQIKAGELAIDATVSGRLAARKRAVREII